jgi:hypothetical protein
MNEVTDGMDDEQRAYLTSLRESAASALLMTTSMVEIAKNLESMMGGFPGRAYPQAAGRKRAFAPLRPAARRGERGAGGSV